eukprot:492146-Amphidinium_carterae.1
MQDSHDRLDQEDTAKYRSLAGSVLYLFLDRPDIQFSAGHLCQCLCADASCTWWLRHQEVDGELSLGNVDADHGGEEGCKSMDSVVVFLGTQQLVSRSSGESEFCAVMMGTACGLQTNGCDRKFDD